MNAYATFDRNRKLLINRKHVPWRALLRFDIAGALGLNDASFQPDPCDRRLICFFFCVPCRSGSELFSS